MGYPEYIAQQTDPQRTGSMWRSLAVPLRSQRLDTNHRHHNLRREPGSCHDKEILSDSNLKQDHRSQRLKMWTVTSYEITQLNGGWQKF